MRTWSCLLWSVVLAAGCDTSGIHALGRLRDPLVPCDADMLERAETTSTWLRSTATGTEIMVLGRPSATDVVATTEPACYGHGTVAHDGSTTFEFGSYTLDADGNGVAVRAVEYVRTHQPELGILSRDGAVRTDLPDPLADNLAIVAAGSKIRVTLDDTAMLMTSLGEVIESLDVTTQAGVDDVFRVYNLPLLTSQSRLLGFGSGAMTQYIGANAEFGGIIRNRFRVNVESLLSPNTLITYFQFEDLTGITIDGEQKTNVDFSGDGQMDGVLSFVMRGTGGPTDIAHRGTIDYAPLIVKDGLAGGGHYIVAIDGVATPYTVSYQLQTNMDLRAVLPVETP